ncbi:hypothetical protein CRUP_005142, partial [Coryphaenoides rupestris]
MSPPGVGAMAWGSEGPPGAGEVSVAVVVAGLSHWVVPDLQAATVNPDPSLKEFEGATLRYASLKLRNPQPVEEEETSSNSCDSEAKCFAVRSLGWVEMAEDDLAPGKSSVAVNNCIRQLSYSKNDIRDTVGIWGETALQ